MSDSIGTSPICATDQSGPETTELREHPSIRLIPLASSSKGNATAIVAGGLVIVVDAGISRRETIRRLSEEGVLNAEKTSPDCLLLTHEHADHAKYVGDWLKHPQPIFATCGTAGMLGLDHVKQWRRARPFQPSKLGPGVVATPIMVPHDAAEPVAWRVAFDGRAAIVATDLGGFPPGWDLYCAGATDLLLEANYHPSLLASCDYPEMLKARIGSPDGHMSVLTVADWVQEKMPATVERLVIGHISRKCCDARIVRHLIAEAAAGKRIELEVLDK